MIISCINANRAEACSFYRGHGVLSELHKLDSSVRVAYYSKFNILDCKGSDVIFFQRPTSSEHLNQIKQIKKLGIPLVIDYDDSFLNIPAHNPFRILQELEGEDYVSNAKAACLLSNQVWVTTQALKDSLKMFSDNIKVIPNAFDDYLYKPSNTCNASNTVLWRGSRHHDKDLGAFQEQITSLIRDFKDFNFYFLGEKLPKWIGELKAQNAGMIRPVNCFEFPFLMQTIRPSLTIVPLEDTPFNRCKSDINLMEGVLAGSNVVCPDWEQWKWNEYRYNNPEEFMFECSSMLKNIRKGETKALNDIWQSNIKHIIKERSLSVINKLRLKALGEL